MNTEGHLDQLTEYEEELTGQLQSQREALQGLGEALSALDDASADEHSEVVQMYAALEAAVSELESALLEVKRSRILAQLQHDPGPAAPSAPAQQPAADSEPRNSSSKVSALAPGAACRFRYVDGRWYRGQVLGPGQQPETLRVHFQEPVRPFMLDPAEVMRSLVRPGHMPRSGVHARRTGVAAGAPVGADGRTLAAGRHALALLPGRQLYEPVELLSIDARRGTATVLPLVEAQQPASRNRQQQGRSAGSGVGVALGCVLVSHHAHVTDDEADEQGGDGGSDDEDAPDGVLAVLLAGHAHGGVGSASEDGSSLESPASSDEDDDDGGGGSMSDDDDGGNEEEQERSDALFGYARLAAAAGPQTDVAHFAEWEVHGRGIASRLMARMGYVRGQGLGKGGRGVTAAPEVLLLPERRGLGDVDMDRVRRVGGSSTLLRAPHTRKRKRGGAKEKRRRAIAASRDAAREAREEREQQGVAAASGAGGLFDFINKSLGDSGDAARIRKAQVALLPGASAAAKRQQLEQQQQQQGAGGPPAAAAGREREGLMSQHDRASAIQGKLKHLGEMLARNATNPGLRKQIEAQMRSTQAELSSVQSDAARMDKAIKDKEALKRLAKF